MNKSTPPLTEADLQAEGIRILWTGPSTSLNANLSLALIDTQGDLMTFCCTLFALNKEVELCSFVFDLAHAQVIEQLAEGTLVTEVESLALECLAAVSERQLVAIKETNSASIH